MTIDGVPVTAGRIVFRNDAMVLDGPIDPDGRYALSWRGRPRVPAGTYGVFLLPPTTHVDVDRDTGAVRPRAPADEATHPLHLRTPGGSGVTRRIEAGEVTVDVDFAGPVRRTPP